SNELGASDDAEQGGKKRWIRTDGGTGDVGKFKNRSSVTLHERNHVMERCYRRDNAGQAGKDDEAERHERGEMAIERERLWQIKVT
uniref:hypothetical protein n=1 Tax=Salmonella enterica TaxID=28901 RepID=UPI00398C4283